MSTPTAPHRPQKATYTPASARQALPLLRSIARDAHETYLRVRGRLQAAQREKPLRRVTSDAAIPEGIREELAAMHGHLRELAELGARLGDPELGLVLLDGAVEGRPGTLCWKLGEETIRYWYPRGERYEDRRPIPTTE